MHKILINGTWIDALSESSREINNPATLQLLGTVPDCGPKDVARAVAAAKAAQRGWWKVPVSKRRSCCVRSAPESALASMR